MISVIMPVWNGARFMDRAIASVVAQTVPNWELLIVDDGSTDDSFQRASRWQELVNSHLGEEKIRLFRTEGSNSGMAIGCNLAAQRARYDVFAYLHQDDLFFPRRVESLLPYFEKYDLVFAPYEILENGKLTLWNKKKQGFKRKQKNLKLLNQKNFITKTNMIKLRRSITILLS